MMSDDDLASKESRWMNLNGSIWKPTVSLTYISSVTVQTATDQLLRRKPVFFPFQMRMIWFWFVGHTSAKLKRPHFSPPCTICAASRGATSHSGAIILRVGGGVKEEEPLSSPATQEADHLFTFPDHGGTRSHSIRGRRRQLSPRAQFKQL